MPESAKGFKAFDAMRWRSWFVGEGAWAEAMFERRLEGAGR